jgi:hypothetical protein
VANQDDVRRVALALPGAVERPDRFAFAVPNRDKLKDFAWVWMERLEPKKARVPRPDVLAVRVASQDEKAMLIAAEPDKFFTEPHYSNFPAVLIRLDAATMDEVAEMIADAWECQAPRPAVIAFERA